MKVEVQIRTIAMNFWASLEHQMHYKQFGNEEMPEIVNELTVCADTIYNTSSRYRTRLTQCSPTDIPRRARAPGKAVLY